MRSGRIGIVSGSGIDLRPLLDEVTCEQPFHAIRGLAEVHVPGHAGMFVHGRCGGRDVVLQCGRLHVYEGLPVEDVVRTVDVLYDFGVKALVFTNTAGGLLPEMRPGVFAAADLIRTWRHRAYPLPDAIVPDFVVPGCDFTGVYCWMHGPCYETQAEIAALRCLGGATVGMSVAPEMARCRELGLRGGVVSCVTNTCVMPEVLTHERVVEVAQRFSRKLCTRLRAALPELP